MYKTVTDIPSEIDNAVNELVADGWTVINSFHCGIGKFRDNVGEEYESPLITFVLYKEPPASPKLPERSFIGKH